jgi:hypothetical protein
MGPAGADVTICATCGTENAEGALSERKGAMFFVEQTQRQIDDWTA